MDATPIKTESPQPGFGRARAKLINLALQGGGAHGAFTWGVLDRLLEDGRLRPAAVSGASAGAVNAVGLAAGLAEGGPEAARAKLAELWRAVADKARLNPLGNGSGATAMADLMTRVLSPYQFNPMDLNPLRDVLERLIDFDRLRRVPPVDLYIAATDVATGRARIFRNPEISAAAVLASACLPQLYRAVEIDGRHYWDGGYSANPPLMPLVRDARAGDTLVVQIERADEPEVPRRAPDILGRLNRITFNGPLLAELAEIEHCRQLAEGALWPGGALRRIARHRLHLIGAGEHTSRLPAGSKLSPDWRLLQGLRDSGRAAVEDWLARHLADIGRRATIDSAGRFS